VNLEIRTNPTDRPNEPACTCTHSRLISDSVSEEEHKAGKVRCVECGGVVPDPHLQREARES
jgi:hypothetical protein